MSIGWIILVKIIEITIAKVNHENKLIRLIFVIKIIKDQEIV